MATMWIGDSGDGMASDAGPPVRLFFIVIPAVQGQIH